jgi:hypothetical protein
VIYADSHVVALVFFGVGGILSKEVHSEWTMKGPFA